LHVVGADSYDVGAGHEELGSVVSKVLGLGGAARCERLGVEINDGTEPLCMGQNEPRAIGGDGVDFRGNVADLEHGRRTREFDVVVADQGGAGTTTSPVCVIEK